MSRGKDGALEHFVSKEPFEPYSVETLTPAPLLGAGNRLDLVFVGEGPGADEDAQGEPFVGAAGKLLNDLLQSAGLSRSEVYIANVIKCRPPNNRDPEPDEVDTCKPFLLQQIRIINPTLVCTLGKWATETILERKVGITKIRGHAIRLKDFVVFPLLHPAAALHQGGLLEPLREDFQKLKAYLEKAKAQSTDQPPTPCSTPEHPQQAPQVQQVQMDLFGS